MGYVMNEEGFSEVVHALSQSFRIYAPVLKKGAGRLEWDGHRIAGPSGTFSTP